LAEICAIARHSTLPVQKKLILTFARSRVARKNNGRKNRLRKMMLLHHH
jgi:hypothetical protein